MDRINESIVFEPNDIANYYDQTEIHYRYFWDLDNSHALHYGIWYKDTLTFKESLLNTNKVLAERAKIDKEDMVLDAGCGIGGSAMYLANNLGCTVYGISLSSKQISKAKKRTEQYGLGEQLSFEVMSYCETTYQDKLFDVVWALESVGSAPIKEDFIKEAFRVLKPGGRLVVADYFKTSNYPLDSKTVMKTWLNGWAISDLETVKSFQSSLVENNFSLIGYQDFTNEISRSSKRMYYASFLGFIGTKVYNFFKNGSPFSKIHYKSGIAQYKALKQGLWQYGIFTAKKPLA